MLIRLVRYGMDVENHFRQQTNDPEARYSTEYPIYLRYSNTLAAFILFETRAKSLAREIRKANDHLKFSLSDFNGSFIEKLKNFLKQVEWDRLHSDKYDFWAELKLLQSIRNSIVHADGLLEDLQAKDRSFLNLKIEERSDLSTTADGFIFLEEKYPSYALDVIFHFFDKLYDIAGYPEFPENEE